MGFPDTTQDVDLFPQRSADNGGKLAQALIELGFQLTDRDQDGIRAGKDFVQLKNGPFDVDLRFDFRARWHRTI